MRLNLEKFGQLTCYLCLKPVGEDKMNIEHSTPVCRLGTHAVANLGISHWKCNRVKGTRTLEEWLSSEDYVVLSSS